MNKNQTESWLCYCRMYLHRLAVTVSPHLTPPVPKVRTKFSG